MNSPDRSNVAMLSSQLLELRNIISTINNDINNIRKNFAPAISYILLILGAVFIGLINLYNNIGFDFDIYYLIFYAVGFVVLSLGIVATIEAYFNNNKEEPKLLNKITSAENEGFLWPFLGLLFSIVLYSQTRFAVFILLLIPVCGLAMIAAIAIHYLLLLVFWFCVYFRDAIFIVFIFSKKIYINKYNKILQEKSNELNGMVHPIFFAVLKKIGGGTRDEIWQEVYKVANYVEPDLLLYFLNSNPTIEVINIEGHTLYKYKLAGNGTNMKTIILDEE